MLFQRIWFGMIACSLIYGCITGHVSALLPAALEGAENAIALTLRLGAGYALFGGLMEVGREAGVQRWIERLLRPLLSLLMPHVQRSETREAVAMNLSMNLLGMGNAATPKGLEAMRLLDDESKCCSRVRQDMYMLLILNATSIQLLPTTVLTLRTAAGSANVNAVLLPTLLCTAASTVVGVTMGLLCRGKKT